MNTRILSRGLDVEARHDSEYIQHVAQAKRGFKPLPEKLYVITPIFNPKRYAVRYELYRQFAKHIEESGAILITVELALRDHPFEVTEENNPHHIQLRTDHTLWYKEPLINVGIRYLPKDWKYVAWIDADTKFVRDDWVQETIRLLQQYHVIQMWSQILDVTPDYEVFNNRSVYIDSFMYNYKNRHKNKIDKIARAPGSSSHTEESISIKANTWYGPPGLAWAARREAIDSLGGLIDWAIIGSSDSYMACALIGTVQHHLQKGFHPEYINKFISWQERAERYIRRNVGYMSGVCIHYYHGKKVNRQYTDRNVILKRNRFNPNTDLKYDWQGLYQLIDHGDERSINLRDDLDNYFSQRNEDSIDI